MRHCNGLGKRINLRRIDSRPTAKRRRLYGDLLDIRGRRHGELVQQRLQASLEHHRRAETALRILLQKTMNNLLQLGGDVGGELPQRRRRFEPLLVEHLRKRSGDVQRAAGQKHVQHAAKAIEIAAGIDRPTLGLLGGHEFRRSQHAAHPRETRVAEQVRDAEVGKLQHPFLGQQQVARLDVAMDHAAVVGVPQRPSNGDAELGHLAPGKDATPAKLFFQAASGHEFHGIEDLLLIFAKTENLYDVGMIQLSQRLDLGLETVAEVGLLGHLGGQQFDRSRLARRVIDPHVDRAHTATADSANDSVWAETGGKHSNEVLELRT